MRNGLICQERVGYSENSALRILESLLHGDRQGRTYENCRRPLGERIRGKICAVKIFSAQGDEEIARTDLSRVRRDLWDNGTAV